MRLVQVNATNTVQLAYAAEGIGNEGLCSVSLDGETDIRLGDVEGVNGIVGMTH